VERATRLSRWRCGARLLRVGLTGGMACGKTAVAGMLARRGAHVMEADKVAHHLMQPGTPVYDDIVSAFGRDILESDWQINRKKLARAAFEAPGGSRIAELNHIVHPAVIAHQRQWMDELAARDRNAIAVVEAALLLEAGVKSDFDKLIVVTCAPEQKVERLATRLGIDRDQARAELQRRGSAQLPDEAKLRAADYVIDNSGPLSATEAQVEKLFPELQRLARNP
jgi:dephospho-CoA kinase